MPAPPPDDLDRELQLHAGALRRIAGDLLRDGHAADDVTQTTLQRAVARGVRRPGPLGGWLRTVLENFVRQWHRSERRRIAREGSLPVPGAAPSAADTLARRESLQRVTDAVLQLEEPYQSTILLRYFEDLPPRAIAQRTRTSVATVKSRLQRGLGLLRARLGAAGGGDDWRVALVTTFGWPRLAAGSGTAAAGAWLMGTTTKVLFAAGVLCVGGLLWVDLGSAPIRPVRSEAAGVEPVPATAASASRELHQTGLQREEVPSPVPFDPWLDHPYTLELTVQLVDHYGLPQVGRAVELGLERGTCCRSAEVTAEDGCVSLSLPARTPRGAVLMRDESGVLHRVELQHGRPGRFTLCVAGRAPVLGRIPLVGNLFRNAGGTSPRQVPVLQAGLHPFARFNESETTPSPSGSLPIVVTLTQGTYGYRTALANLESATDAAVVTTPGGGQFVEGLVLDEHGEPVPALVVALLGTGPQPLQTLVTGGDGRFGFADAPTGHCTLRAGGGPEGLAILPVDVGPRMPPVTMQLCREGNVRGTVQTPTGTALANLRVTWMADDGSWADLTTTNGRGAFVFANLPSARGRIFVWSPDAPLPVASIADVLPGQRDLMLQFDPSATSGSALQFEPRLPDACAGSPITARLWQRETGLGAELPQPEAGKPWHTNGRLPAGWYRLELFAPGCGWTDRGNVWLDGTHDCNLGGIDLPAPGIARFAPPDEPRELCRLGRDLDVRMQLAPEAFDQPLLLPAGDYALLLRHHDGGIDASRFTVQSGATIDVTRD